MSSNAIKRKDTLHLEIQKRDEEKSKFLSFSNAIASASDRAVISRLIQRQLAELFGLTDYCFFLLSPDKTKRFPFLFDPDSVFATHPNFLSRIETGLDNDDGIFDVIVKTNELVVFDFEDLKTRNPPHPFIDVIEAMNLKQMGGNMVFIGKEPVGVMTFAHSNAAEIKKRFSLYEAICSQLAIVASNLYNTQKISRKEEETAKILAFSNAIASVQEKAILAKIIQVQLRDIFGIEDYCIWLNGKDKLQRIPFLYDREAPIAQHPLFEQGLMLFTSKDDYLFGKSLETDKVVFLTPHDWDGPSKVGYAYADFAKAFKFNTLGASRIRLAGEDLAVMVFSHNNAAAMKENLKLYRSICSQLAITLSNLLAKQKIVEQLKEIDRYKTQLEEEKIYLQEEIATVHNYEGILCESPKMKKVLDLIDKVAASNSSVLILGETGTGKELIARAIHAKSTRKDKIMVKVNCAALPANLIESELFGHEKGSFTGAFDRKIGKFELANRGTLFLDEVGELPVDLQAKLLRVLQEKEIERIGGKETIKLDVRIIAATNRDLVSEIAKGRFREDLYYRLNIFPVELPPLKERIADLPLLVNFFITKYAKQSGKKIRGVSNAVMSEILCYPWPGNIRELEHFIERNVLLTNSDTITGATLQMPEKKRTPKRENTVTILRTLDESEREIILATLDYCNGRISGPDGAADILGIPSTTLHSKMKRLGIVKSHVRTKG